MSNDDTGKRRVTMGDIAKACGVSSMTVSLALRNNPRISEKTRVMVTEKAVELGYSPDPVLSALNQYRHNSKEKSTQATLALINPFLDPKRQHALTEFEFYWEGAAEIAMEYGYRLEEFVTKDIPLHRMDTIFKTRNIKGILIAQLGAKRFIDANAGWEHFPWKDYACVRFGRVQAYPAAHYVTSSQARNTVTAFNQIRARGYKRVGFAGFHTQRRVFCMGAYFAQIELPENEQVPSLLYTLDHSEEDRLKLLKQWLEKHQPDAILTDIANLPDMLNGLGYRVPDDFGLATTTIYDTPIDAGIDQKPKEIGRAAVRMLVALINEQNYGIPDTKNAILIEGQWVDGSMLPNRS